MVPDVFADGHADPPAGKVDDARLRRRLEIPVLVEHVVGRQEAFAGDKGNLTPPAPCGSVEERPALAGGVCLHEPDQRRDVADPGGDFRQR